MDKTSFIVCSQANFSELVKRTGLRKSVGAAKKAQLESAPGGTTDSECDARCSAAAPEKPLSTSHRASIMSTECSNDEAFVRDRFDSAWGRTMEERPSWVCKDKSTCHNFRYVHDNTSNCGVEAAVQASFDPVEGAQHIEDGPVDAQLIELRRIAHRAEAERAEARMAQVKAQKCASAAQNECKNANAKVQALESQLVEKSEKLAEYEAQMKSMTAASNQLDTRLQAAQSKSDTLKRKVSQLQAQLKNHEQLESDQSHAKQTIQQLQGELRNLKQRFLAEMNTMATDHTEAAHIRLLHAPDPDRLGHLDAASSTLLCTASKTHSSSEILSQPQAATPQEAVARPDHHLAEHVAKEPGAAEAILASSSSSQSPTDCDQCTASAPEASHQLHGDAEAACSIVPRPRMLASADPGDTAPGEVSSPPGVDQGSQTDHVLTESSGRLQKNAEQEEVKCVTSACQCDLVVADILPPGKDDVALDAAKCLNDVPENQKNSQDEQVACAHTQNCAHQAAGSDPCTPVQGSSVQSEAPTPHKPCLQVSPDTLQQVEDILQGISSHYFHNITFSDNTGGRFTPLVGNSCNNDYTQGPKSVKESRGDGELEPESSSNAGNLALTAYLSHLTASIANILTARGTNTSSNSEANPIAQCKPAVPRGGSTRSAGSNHTGGSRNWCCGDSNTATFNSSGDGMHNSSSTSGTQPTHSTRPPPSGYGENTGTGPSMVCAGAVATTGTGQRPLSAYNQAPGQSVSAAVHCLSAMNDRLALENQQLLEEAAQKHAAAVLQAHRNIEHTTSIDSKHCLKELEALSSDSINTYGGHCAESGTSVACNWQALPEILGCGTWQTLLEGMLSTLETIKSSCASVYEPRTVDKAGSALTHGEEMHKTTQGDTARSQLSTFEATDAKESREANSEQKSSQSGSELQSVGSTSAQEDVAQLKRVKGPQDDRVVLAIARVAVHLLVYTEKLQSQLLERSAAGIQHQEHQAALQTQIQELQAELQTMHKRVQVAERQGRRSFAGLKSKLESTSGQTSGSGADIDQSETSSCGSSARNVVEDSKHSSTAHARPRSASAGRSGASAELHAQIQRLNVALGACSRDKAKHETMLKKRAEEAEAAAAESAVALQRSVARSKELQRRLEDKDALLAAAGFSESASGAAALRACQVREHQREILSLNKEISSLQAQLHEAQRTAAKAKEQGTLKFISAAKEASAAAKTASETRKDAEESLHYMAAHLEDKERRIQVLSELVRVAEDQTSDAIQLVSVLKQQRDSEGLAGVLSTTHT